MKTNPDDNAFPTTRHGPTDGLTKREYFAALAMPGILSSEFGKSLLSESSKKFDGDPKAAADVVSLVAVMYADSLIDALNKEPESHEPKNQSH